MFDTLRGKKDSKKEKTWRKDVSNQDSKKRRFSLV
jgi:hypothetical protein